MSRIGWWMFVLGLAWVLGPPARAQNTVGSPKNLVVTTPAAPDGINRLELHWDKVKGAVGYEVLQWRGGKWWFNEEDPNRTPLTSSTTIYGLEPETAYEFCIRAVAADGTTSAPGSPMGGRTLGREIHQSSRPAPTPPPKEVVIDTGKGPGGGTSSPDKTDKTPAPEAPTGLFAVFSEQDRIKLSFRPVPGAVRYVIEEEKDGKWGPAENIVGEPAATSVVLLDHPTPGPYKLRVRSMGRNGKLSEASWVINVER